MSRQVYAKRSGREKLDIYTPNRVYYLKEVKCGDAGEWVDIINNTISEYCEDV